MTKLSKTSLQYAVSVLLFLILSTYATAQVPTITSLGTSSGCGTTALTIYGTNFTGVTAANVKVGGVPVSSINFNVGTQMAVMPVSGSSGIVTVTNGAGTSTATLTYTSSSNPGAFGNALSFDGSNDYAMTSTTNIVQPNANGEYTVAVWAKYNGNTAPTSYMEIFGQGHNLYFGPSNDGKFRISDFWTPNINFPTDQLWHHYAIVRGINESYFYMDGTLAATYTSAANSWTAYSISSYPGYSHLTNIPMPPQGDAWGGENNTTGDKNFIIGSQHYDSRGSEVFDGSVDELSIWNYAKSEDQIRSIMNVELVGNESGLLAYYNFNQGIAGGSNGTETTLYDRTSNGNNATLTNMALTGSSSNWVGSYTYTMANITGTTSVCPLSTTQMSNTTLGGVWSFSSSTYATVNSTGLVTGVATGTPTLRYRLTSGVAGCTLTKTTMITVLASPSAPIGTGAARCSTGTVTISATPGSGNVIDWYDAATGGNLLLSGTSNYTTPSISATTTYYAEARNTTSGCISTTRTPVTATVYEQPVANAGGDQTLCNTSTFTMAAVPSVGTGAWSLVSGTATITTSSSATTTITSVPTNTNITLRWTETNGTCSSSYDDVVIRNDASATVSNAGSDQTLCNTSTFTMAGNSPSSGTGAWSLVSGTATITTSSSETTTITSVPTNSNITLRWTITNGTCSSTDDVVIRNDAAATVSNAGSDQSLCNTSTFTMAGNSPSSGTSAWSLVSGSATITSASSATTTITSVPTNTNITLRWTITNGTCSSTDDVVIRNDAAATVSNAGSDQTLCNTSTFTMAGISPSSGTGAWSLVSGLATITSASSATTSITSVPTNTNITLRWTITNGTCSSTDDVVIRNDAAATVANAGSDQTLCNTSTFTMAGNSPSSGTGAWSLVSGSATITSASSATTTITSVPTNSDISLRWTITNGTCSSADDVVIRNSLPNATISVTPSSCSTSLSVPSSSTYLWSNGSTSNPISVVTSGTYTVTVTDAYGCTNSSSTTVTVSDNTAPTMNCVANGNTNYVYNKLAAGGVSNTNDKSFANISRWAQKFTAGNSGSISNIKLNIYRDQISATGSFEVQIWVGNSTTPSAKLVTLKTLNWPDMPLNTTGTNNSNYFSITSFDTNFTLMSGTAYWLVISQASNGPAPKRWTISGTGNQTASYNQNNGTWTDRGTTNNLGAQITISDPIRKTSVNCTYVTAGTEFDPVCSDNCGINTTSYSLSGATTASGNTTLAGVVFNKGVTNVSWTTSDNAGNTSTCSYTVTVADDDAPAISLNGSSTVNTCLGSTYSDNGATATDNCDGNVTANIISSGTVNTAVAGNYTISYNVSDQAGNAATTVTRTVVVNPLPTATISAGGPTTFNYGGSVLLSAPTSGNAITLNGTSNYLSIPSSINSNFSGNQITVEGWFYPTQLFAISSLIGESYEGDNLVKFSLFSENESGVQKIKAGYYSAATNWVRVESSTSFTLNQWTHVAATYDQSNIKIYVNGNLTATLSATDALPSGSERWLLGKHWDLSNFFPGKMDEVRIWNVARSQAQIQASMNTTVASQSSGLVGYYKLDESSGTTATDATGNGYNGTVN